MSSFDKPYNPKEIEDKIYSLWEKSGYFNPDKLPVAKKLKANKLKTFTIIMPPPNANGTLHIGHALFVTLQDIMIRYKRMKGLKTLWLPGADHAGFETQVVFDKKLEKEGRNRFEIPRDELYKEMLEFTLTNKKLMENQLRKLGASCDWSREKFTLDPDIVKKTQETFIQMYKDGLIYRGNRIINWCVKHQTTLSDLEVEHEEKIDPLYYIKYGPLTLATVRPETKFGDTALAVHPKDNRYKKYIGKEIEIETLLGPAKIKVIGDEAVDIAFGTGVVKVTPAHDPIDFEIGQRHKLEIREVIDKYGKLNDKTGPYAGLKIKEAREKVAEDMKSKGLLVKINPNYKHNVAVCYKCRTVIEPLVMPQWFVKMTETPITNNQQLTTKGTKSLRDLGVEVVKQKKIKFIPSRFEKIYYQWMKNLKDWAISRQIIWGIRIPAWFCMEEIVEKGLLPKKEIEPHQSLTYWRKWLDFSTKPIFIGINPPQKCPRCGKKDLIQDPDVLDTWFSSGQWPYLTLDYPNGKDYKTYYPTTVMETGWDILFKWVSRMIIFGVYRTGKIPFKYVYLHGLVLDKDRKKMSKSKGNVIDPLAVTELYGTDAARMALIIGNAPGNDVAISEEKIRGYRNFANKIWQATRFLLLSIPGPIKNSPSYNPKEKAMLKKLTNIKKEVTKDIETFKFHHAAEKLYHFFWHYYADKVIEEMKPTLKSKNPKERDNAKSLLLEFHATLIKLLHPFMPFITEEIYQQLPIPNKKLLMIENWQ